MGLAPIERVSQQIRSGSGEAFSRSLVAVDMGDLFMQSASLSPVFSGIDVPQGTLSRLTAIHLVNTSMYARRQHPCCRRS